MRKVIMRSCVFFFSLFICSCHKGEEKKLSCFIICDKIDSGFVKDFETILTSGNRSLGQTQPSGIALITFNVYITTVNEVGPISVSFKKERDKNVRFANADLFLNKLRSHINTEGGWNKNILSALEAMVSATDENDVEYKILINSDMVESSAEADDIRTAEENWRDGKFNFATPFNRGYDCNNAAVKEAQRQLNDSDSWISDYLIEKGNSRVSNAEVILSRTGATVRSVENGCSGKDIDKFWDNLFDKMHIKYKKKNVLLRDFISLN